MMNRAIFGIFVLSMAVIRGAEPPLENFISPDEVRKTNKVTVVLLRVDDVTSKVHRRYGQPAFEATPMAEPVDLTTAQQSELAELLELNASRIPAFYPPSQCILHPDSSVKFAGEGGASVEFVFCFSCGDMIVLRERSAPISIAIGYTHREFVTFFRSCFPQDPRWQALIAQENRIPESLQLLDVESGESDSTR
jgi:hypothetical protein